MVRIAIVCKPQKEELVRVLPDLIAWLRQRGVAVSGAPRRLTSGPWAGRMALDFVAPWGLRMRLLGSRPPDATYGGADTVAAVPRGH